jgi:hypothetical protein
VLRGAVMTAQAAAAKSVLADGDGAAAAASAALARLAAGVVCEAVCSGLLQQNEGEKEDTAQGECGGTGPVPAQAETAGAAAAAERQALASLQQLGFALAGEHAGEQLYRDAAPLYRQQYAT